MAFVMKTDSVASFLENKLILTDGVTTKFAIDDITHADIIAYPAQGEFTEGVNLAILQKPFIDFAISCGKAGAMTADMITAKYAGFPVDVAETIAADFAKAYGNYVIIPEGISLMITTNVSSVVNLMIPTPPVEKTEE